MKPEGYFFTKSWEICLVYFREVFLVDIVIESSCPMANAALSLKKIATAAVSRLFYLSGELFGTKINPSKNTPARTVP